MAPFPQTRVLAHEKPGPGRPCEYRPEFCQAVIEHMSQGHSLTSFAGSILMSRDTVYRWMTEFREFSDAVSRARSARVQALEAKLLRSRKGAETTAAIFALRNADPVEWRDVKHTEHQHVIDASQLTDAQLMAIAAGRSAADAGVIEADYSVVEPPGRNG